MKTFRKKIRKRRSWN